MKTQFEIEDFSNSSFPIIKLHYELFEVAKIMENSMARGQVFLAESKIKFQPLELNSYVMQVFERLRMWSTPKLKDTKFGKLLVWDDYALRIRS